MFYSKIPTQAQATELKPTLKLPKPQHLSGWKLGSSIAASAAWIVFIINICFFTWLASRPSLKGGNGVAFEGNCKTSRALNIFIHLLINILSTCLLGASNYCMQCLNAPTREDVDKAHADGKWLDIGVPSLRNLRIMTKGRLMMWSLLALSSVPLHLFYNSIVFTTAQANQYSVSIVSQDLFTGTPWSLSCDNPFISSLLERAQTNASSFQKLSNSDCIKEYATGLEVGRGDVILVSTYHDSNNSLLYNLYPLPYLQEIGGLDSERLYWICEDTSDGSPCTPRSVPEPSSNWTVHELPIEYCLSKVINDPCQLQFNIFILLVVAICNLLKALIMTWLALRYKASELVTLGDAVASFLENPDPTTARICMASSRDIRRGEWKSTRPQVYSETKKRWWRAVSRTEWWTTNSIWATGLTMFLVAGLIYSVPLSLSMPGSINNWATVGVNGNADNMDSSLLYNVLVSNAPQLGLSLLYLFLNGFYTSLSVAREWCEFSGETKALRVSQNPIGSQTSTRFLSLPSMHSACLMVGSALLHWLLAESFFFVHGEVFDIYGNPVPSDAVDVIGYSTVGLLVIFIVFAIISSLNFMLGFFKRFPTAMPVVGTCSAGISAACHPIGEGNVSEKAVAWGEVSGEDHEGHCSFTSKEVGMPVVGHTYGGDYCEGLIKRQR
ncbi:hypothetical protein N431DRAFT_406186 [Stipitochalara longipes BDJ]|nr:hypothetical protein N431DRAFT_406186 [Stipitochalara longipes BDJ]